MSKAFSQIWPPKGIQVKLTTPTYLLKYGESKINNSKTERERERERRLVGEEGKRS